MVLCGTSSCTAYSPSCSCSVSSFCKGPCTCTTQTPVPPSQMPCACSVAARSSSWSSNSGELLVSASHQGEGSHSASPAICTLHTGIATHHLSSPICKGTFLPPSGWVSPQAVRPLATCAQQQQQAQFSDTSCSYLPRAHSPARLNLCLGSGDHRLSHSRALACAQLACAGCCNL